MTPQLQTTALPSSVHSLSPADAALRGLGENTFSAHSQLACCPQCRLQTCAATHFLWKSQGSGQGPHWPSLNVHPHQGGNREPVIGAICRTKFKFPGHQKIRISKWGFTQFNAGESENMVAEKRLILDSFGARYIPNPPAL